MAPRFYEMVIFHCEMNSCNTTVNAIWCICLAVGALFVLICCSNLLELQCMCINISHKIPHTYLLEELTNQNDLLTSDNSNLCVSHERYTKKWHCTPPPPYHPETPCEAQIYLAQNKIQIL